MYTVQYNTVQCSVEKQTQCTAVHTVHTLSALQCDAMQYTWWGAMLYVLAELVMVPLNEVVIFRLQTQIQIQNTHKKCKYKHKYKLCSAELVRGWCAVTLEGSCDIQTSGCGGISWLHYEGSAACLSLPPFLRIEITSIMSSHFVQCQLTPCVCMQT